MLDTTYNNQQLEMPTRHTLARIHQLLRQAPALDQPYRMAKQVIRAFRKPAFYEISQRCNLWCEGCYYFENKNRLDSAAAVGIDEFDTFFAGEQSRGVSMGYFVGAEPALEQRRLRAAAGRIPYGKIGTNGTIRIAPDIPFRIGVSVWGDEDTDRTLRGGGVLHKALRNYEGDPRAIMLFTLSPWNLHTVPAVLAACSDHGLPVTFSMFSPTETYLNKIRNGAPADNRFFRVAAVQGAPSFTDDDLRKAADVTTWGMQEYPETVLFSSVYRDWNTRPGPLYDIDPETGVAENCGSRIVGHLRYHTTEARSVNVKCCTPDIDCSECRLYSGGWSSQFRPAARFLSSPDDFAEWLDMINVLGRIFLYPLPDAYNEASSIKPIV